MISQRISHYEIQGRLGEGGMGVVYRALDTHLDRYVAIKVLRPEAVADPQRKRRFVQEAKAASALNHPNIITIHDISTDHGVDFIVMEHVRGKSLDQLVAARGRAKGLGLREALQYAVQIADGLAKAHAAGIVHRDLKPGNVMVTEDGLVKVLDFGLAKLTEPAGEPAGEEEETETVRAEVSPATQEGSILGTVAYMSPEQAQGQKVDARSDIFSFGVVLYELLSSRRPFLGETRLSILSAILREEPKPLAEIVKGIPQEVGRIISLCLRKDPRRRFQHMEDLKIALEALLEEPESGGLAAVPTLAPRHWSRWVAMAAVLTLMVGIAIAVWWRSARSPAGTSGPAAPLRTSPFTSFPGQESQPAFSPDGKQVAFVWEGETGGNFDVYVRLVAGGTPLRLTSNPADEFSPTWSPDGSRIAFLRQTSAGQEIVLIPALGGPERKLCQTTATIMGAVLVANWVRAGLGLAWSPDGGLLAIVDKASPQESDSIFVVETDTGKKRKLTSLPVQYFGDRFPAFSPNGQTLAFIRFRNFGVSDIHLLPVTGGGLPGEPTRLTFDDKDIRGLDWTADGRSIVFSSSRGGSLTLWRIPISGGAPERLAVSGETALFPSVARQGGRLAYVQSAADLNIWRAAGPAAVLASKAKPAKFISSTQWDSNPQISPDGKRIVFASARSGSGELWVCDEAGLNPVQLTSSGGALSASPRWSPDSQQVVFDSRVRGQADIHVVSREGGPPRRITTEPSNEARPSWSRDGRWIYFGSDRTGNWQVWKAPAEGGAAMQVTRQGGRETQESPNGKFLYYHKGVGLGIWRVPPEGGDEVQVLDRGEAGQWAVLDHGICLLNRRAVPEPTIEFFGFATRRSSKITSLPKQAGAPLLIPSLAVSPDGRWILYVQVDQTTSDVMLAENFR